MTPFLPGFTIVRDLGSGATATVYLAVQDSLNRRVALKVLSRSLSADASFCQRFLREGRIVAKLNHPHVVPVFDVGEHDGDLYMAMEYLGGGSLAERHDLTVGELLSSLRQIVSALEYAHQQGFVHRDIKPENILFRTDGTAMLTDFGVARATESLTRMTVTGAIIGTPAYMSPEQVSGTELDGRADLYSVGVVLYEFLSGHRPFTGSSIMSVGLQHLTAEAPPLPATCRHFEPVVSRLLSKKPDDRYDDASELLAAIDELGLAPAMDPSTPIRELHSESPPSSTALAGTLSPTRARQAAPARLRWTLAAFTSLALATLGAWYFYPASDPDPVGAGVGVAPQNEAETPIASDASSAPEADPSAEALERLLEQARAAARDERWFEPEDESAIFYYRSAAALAPDSELVATGLEGIRTDAARRTELDIAAGRFDSAERTLAAMARTWPADDDVAALADRLDAARREANLAAQAQARQQRIATSLALAAEALRAGRLVEPPDASALFHYRSVLDVDSENALATAGVDTVTEQLLGRAEQAIADDDFDFASDWLAAARAANPGHARIAAVDTRLQSRRDTLAAEQQRVEQDRLFNQQVRALQSRVGDWAATPTADQAEAYPDLYAETEALLAVDPENTALQAIRILLDRQREAMQQEAEDEDRARFDVPAF